MSAPEDGALERKTENDLKDVLRTVVGLANSIEVERCGVMFIGVRDDGRIEGVRNPDQIQKSVEDKVRAAYPRIEALIRVVTVEGQSVVCVLIPGSERRPHFAGPAYVRVGSVTREASDEQFASLIAESSAKVRRLRSLVGKSLRVQHIRRERAEMLGRVTSDRVMTLEECGRFSVRLRDQYGGSHEVSLERVRVLEEEFPGSARLEVLPD